MRTHPYEAVQAALFEYESACQHPHLRMEVGGPGLLPAVEGGRLAFVCVVCEEVVEEGQIYE